MYYKSLLINCCTYYTSAGSNCEDANLGNLIDFLTVSSNYAPDFNNDVIIPYDIAHSLLVVCNDEIVENVDITIQDVLSVIRTCHTCCAIVKNNQQDVLLYIRQVRVVIDYFIDNHFHITGLVRAIQNCIRVQGIKLICTISCEQQHISVYITNNYIIKYIRKRIKAINSIFNGTSICFNQESKVESAAAAYAGKSNKK